MKNLKKLSRKDLKNLTGSGKKEAGFEMVDGGQGLCGSICSSHADCKAAIGTTSCGVCTTIAIGLAGRCS